MTHPTLDASRVANSAPLVPGIVHLGLGNFHRAHQAVYTAVANRVTGSNWGIVAVANRSRRIVEAMLAQDLLYTVIEISPDGYQYTVPAVHTNILVGAEEPEAVVSWIADPRIKIVTLTVTEHGYHIDPATGGLQRNAEILADLAGDDPPRTFLGQLVRGLQQRMGHGAPVTVLSCDNLAANGRRLKAQVLEFCEAMSDGAGMREWVQENVSFPCSMVDRIVPSTQPEHVADVRKDCGYNDEVPVPAEPFTMWALEDDFIAGRPAWENFGAVFTPEVERYEEMKLRLLNGTHSLLAYTGALAGLRTIPDAVADPQIRTAAHRLLRNEYGPSVEMPSDLGIDAYEKQLLQRWRNSALGHQTSQVGSDGSVKLPQRIVEPALLHLGLGRIPHYLALTVAAWLSCVAPLDGFDPGRYATEIKDPAIPGLRALAAAAHSGADLATAVFASGGIFPEELAQERKFITRIGELIDLIHSQGIKRTLAEVATGHPDPTPRPD